MFYAVAYEALAVVVVGPALGWLFGGSAARGTGLAVAMSLIALAWSYAFNAAFERWEARRPVPRRTLARRVAHGVAFEGGLVVMLVPLMAWWFDTTLLGALLADLGVLAFFLLYAIAFTWAFDRVFGEPHSAHREPP